jgi:DNA-3-methyladenine glycosylase I
MSTALKQRGFSWVAPKTLYAFMQAAGMVNDHIARCHCHQAASRE